MAGDQTYPSVGSFYNADIRNNGTARRVTEAMYRLGMKDHGFVRYTRPAGPELVEHDLHLFIDDGRDDIAWLPPKPNACWLIDTHLGWDKRLEWAKQFDTVFVAQLDAVGKMKEAGVENSHWLPLACNAYLDPCYEELKKHFGDKVNLTREWDLCFVGFLNQGVNGDPTSHDRVSFLDRMFREFPNSWMAFNCFFEQAATRYVKARVGLNISIRQDLNMRFFECMSYGVPQLCNRDMVGWKELGFIEGVHFIGWGDEDEAVEQARRLLEDMEWREEIAKLGFDLVRSEHTYECRVKQLLEVCGFTAL
jgi:hypothetical protein